jgi:hypothetical protein
MRGNGLDIVYEELNELLILILEKEEKSQKHLVIVYIFEG